MYYWTFVLYFGLICIVLFLCHDPCSDFIVVCMTFMIGIVMVVGLIVNDDRCGDDGGMFEFGIMFEHFELSLPIL